VPVELAHEALAASVAHLHAALPALEILPVCADFAQPRARYSRVAIRVGPWCIFRARQNGRQLRFSSKACGSSR
jgi:hypothetical protein